MARYYTNCDYITSYVESGFVPPEAFIYRDSKQFTLNYYYY